MDEVGSSMAHSDTPNCVCAPFIYVGRGTVSYSIIFPIEDIPKGGALTRDFVPADIKDPITRKAYLQIYNNAQDAAELIAVYEVLLNLYKVTHFYQLWSRQFFTYSRKCLLSYIVG